jgi:hypothetical protein
MRAQLVVLSSCITRNIRRARLAFAVISMIPLSSQALVIS